MNLSETLEKAKSQLSGANDAPESGGNIDRESLFSGIEIDYLKEEPLPVMIQLDESILAIRGGLFVVFGESKAGKSAVCDAILASAIQTPTYKPDTFGIEVTPNVEKHAVVMFDTERGRYGLPQAARRILRRSGRTNGRTGQVERPEHFYCFNLKNKSVKERALIVKLKLEELRQKHGGIHLVLLDGLADWVESVNDEQESNNIVKWSEDLAGTFQTVVATVVHFNPGSDKGRGHLGSQLQRKCEGAIMVKKANDVSEITANASNGHSFIRYGRSFEPRFFSWSNAESMHVSCDKPEGKGERESGEVHSNAVIDYVNELLTAGPIAQKDAVSQIAEYFGKSETWAKGKFKEYTDASGNGKRHLDGVFYTLEKTKQGNGFIYQLVPEEKTLGAVVVNLPALARTEKTDVPF